MRLLLFLEMNSCHCPFDGLMVVIKYMRSPVQLLCTKVQTIYSVIKDLLIRYSLPLSQCQGQAFDGASNMSGVRNGVQSLIKIVLYICTLSST